MNNDKAKELKEDFPIFKLKVHGKKLVYLDNASTTQKPAGVIDAVRMYYERTNANIHRGVYKLSEQATELYEDAHDTVGGFINAGGQETVFTGGTTGSINLLSYTLPSLLKGRTDIVLTEMEHHSNLVPWQQLAKRNGLSIKFIRMKDDFTLDYGDAEAKITDNAAIVAFGHVSNTTGTIHDAKSIVKLAKSLGAITVIDAAQSVPHMPVDVKELGCDFLVFSGHKMLGPTGTGVLYGRQALLEKLEPFHFGGDMIRKVSYETAEWNELPWKFEAGTPHIAGGIGLAEAVRYLGKIGMAAVAKWEHELLDYALDKIQHIKGIALYTAGARRSAGILSFNLGKAHAHDVASLLDDDGICIRGGHHCAMPLMQELGISGTARASFYLYNTHEDVELLASSLKKTQELFGNG